MAFGTMQFYSKQLQTMCSMNVITPRTGDGPFPVLYLLHGLSDNHTAWSRYTTLEMQLAEMPMIVVMPDGGRGWYLDDPRPGGLAWEQYMIEDVVCFVDTTFRTIRSREGRAIAGLSMGGHGALGLAMKHPEIYSMASTHSGAVFFGHHPRPSSELHDINAVNAFADAINASETGDLWSISERYLSQKAAELPLSIRMDCGTEDELIDDNREFHAHLDAVGLAHDYAEYSGGHRWDYWNKHVYKTLRFVRDGLTSGA
ncbi:MAG: esterase family protein [Phycisphaerales bacterium]|jgi:putative tributyrin esterase|nr:esterase family protein [Phycisphaerales bacterium]MBT7171400.1 esterase family protein [Phycisphaerales bacterium]